MIALPLNKLYYLLIVINILNYDIKYECNSIVQLNIKISFIDYILLLFIENSQINKFIIIIIIIITIR